MIQILGRQQSVALSSDIGNLEHKIPDNFALDGQVVLFGILGAHVWSELPVKQNRAEILPSHSLPTRGIQYPVKRIGSGGSILILEGSIEHCVENARTSSERRLGTELLENQLFDRVVKDSKACPNAGFA